MKYLTDFKAMMLWILIVVNIGINFLGFQTVFNEVRSIHNIIRNNQDSYIVEMRYYYTTADSIVLYDVTHPFPYKFNNPMSANEVAKSFKKAEELKQQADSVTYKITLDNGYGE